MDLRLDGKVALVTGASKGIGRAIAAAMAEAGARVMISSRKEDQLKEAASSMSGEVSWYAANAGDPEAAEACVAATVERLGGLDILVNNAATNPYMGPMIGIDVSRANKTVQVNQLGVLVWTQCAWRAAMSERGGSVINTASTGGLSVEPTIGYYNVTKAAVIRLTEQLANELAPGVRVNALAPGLVKTDFARALWEPNEEAIARSFPLRRLGQPQDVANAAVFLVSDTPLSARDVARHDLGVGERIQRLNQPDLAGATILGAYDALVVEYYLADDERLSTNHILVGYDPALPRREMVFSTRVCNPAGDVCRDRDPVIAVWDDLIRVSGSGWEVVTMPHGAKLRVARNLDNVKVIIDGLSVELAR